MKWNHKIFTGLLFGVICSQVPGHGFPQDSTKHDLVLNVGYYVSGNKMMYVEVKAKTKISGRFQPVSNSVVKLYLDSATESHSIARVTTNDKGEAKAIIPPSLKAAWDASSVHTFLGVSEANKEFEQTTAETPVTRSRVTIDTNATDEGRHVIVLVEALKNGKWMPAKDVEMKVGISRLGGLLPAGKQDSYTTDSTGSVNVLIDKDSLPGDEKGNLVLAAKVEENDEYGNLYVEKSVPWGIAFKPDTKFFDQRTLWSTRFKTPIWLLFMAYSIVIGVWGTLIYLIAQVFKIKKLGA